MKSQKILLLDILLQYSLIKSKEENRKIKLQKEREIKKKL